ncbi:MAG: GNAT family N-acetyltransferase [Methanobacteriota archaeon]
MIRECTKEDIHQIFKIINSTARSYEGVIPADCYHEPYMSWDIFLEQFGKMAFCGWFEDGQLVGVMGVQPVKDVTLIRHAYVLPKFQGKGIGSKLLAHLLTKAQTNSILVGTWRAATWAIKFYEKNRFKPAEDSEALLRKYWSIPERQIETSVVLKLHV